jgi:hypothetical protein|nr:MAG TPA: tail assembly protein [Caudoviricetes sp.]
MKNGYRIYVDLGGDTVELPVNPKELTVSYPTDHKTYDVLNTGEIIVPRLPSLMEVYWECYFPGSSSDPLINGHDWEEPGTYVELIEEAMENKEICDLVISRGDASGSEMYDTNISALITKFETTDNGGEAGDVYYKISFKEYRDYGPVKVTLPVPETQVPMAAAPEESERPVTTPVLRVGASVIANGIYFSSSYGDKPTGTANNLTTTVSRIIPDASRPYPVLIGGNRGWIKADQLQVTG